jgi:hypothetical protein
MGLSRLARSTCCQRPFRFSPERCVPVERRSHLWRPTVLENLSTLPRASVNCQPNGCTFTAQPCMYGNCCSDASCGAQTRSKAGPVKRFTQPSQERKTPGAIEIELKILGGLANRRETLRKLSSRIQALWPEPISYWVSVSDDYPAREDSFSTAGIY